MPVGISTLSAQGNEWLPGAISCAHELRVFMRSQSDIHPFVWLTILFDHIGICVALPILPKLVADLVHGSVGVAAFYYGLLLALSGLILFFFSPIQGALSDRFG